MKEIIDNPWQEGGDEYLHSDWSKQFVDMFSESGIPAHIHKVTKQKVVSDAISNLEKTSATAAKKVQILKDLGNRLGIGEIQYGRGNYYRKLLRLEKQRLSPNVGTARKAQAQLQQISEDPASASEIGQLILKSRENKGVETSIAKVRNPLTGKPEVSTRAIGMQGAVPIVGARDKRMANKWMNLNEATTKTVDERLNSPSPFVFVMPETGNMLHSARGGLLNPKANPMTPPGSMVPVSTSHLHGNGQAPLLDQYRDRFAKIKQKSKEPGYFDFLEGAKPFSKQDFKITNEELGHKIGDLANTERRIAERKIRDVADNYFGGNTRDAYKALKGAHKHTQKMMLAEANRMERPLHEIMAMPSGTDLDLYRSSGIGRWHGVETEGPLRSLTRIPGAGPKVNTIYTKNPNPNPIQLPGDVSLLNRLRNKIMGM